MPEITTIEDLVALYPETIETAVKKELPALIPEYRALVEASPYLALATVGPEGVDCTPRGESPGFVHIIDDSTLELPDRKGNNRLDSLRNIVRDPRLAMLFLIPDRNETLRINGRGSIINDPDVLEQYAVGARRPVTVLRIHIESVYFHCGKSAIRSGIWKPETWTTAAGLPTTGQIRKGYSPDTDVDAYDRNSDANLRANLW